MPSRDRDLRSEELRETLQFLLDELYAQGELVLPKEYMRALVSQNTRKIEPEETRPLRRDNDYENERLRARIEELERENDRERSRNRTLSERVERYNDERRGFVYEVCGSSGGGGSTKFDGWSLGDSYDSRDYESSGTCGSSSRRRRSSGGTCGSSSSSYCGSGGVCGS